MKSKINNRNLIAAPFSFGRSLVVFALLIGLLGSALFILNITEASHLRPVTQETVSGR